MTISDIRNILDKLKNTNSVSMKVFNFKHKKDCTIYNFCDINMDGSTLDDYIDNVRSVYCDNDKGAILSNKKIEKYNSHNRFDKYCLLISTMN